MITFSARKIGVFHKSDCYRSHLDVFIFSGKCVFSWLLIPIRRRPPHCCGSESTLRHTTLGRTPVDEWSALRTDLYLTRHNTHKRQTSMPSALCGIPTPSAGFQPAIWESERPQTHALDDAVTEIGFFTLVECSDRRGTKKHLYRMSSIKNCADCIQNDVSSENVRSVIGLSFPVSKGCGAKFACKKGKSVPVQARGAQKVPGI